MISTFLVLFEVARGCPPVIMLSGCSFCRIRATVSFLTEIEFDCCLFLLPNFNCATFPATGSLPGTGFCAVRYKLCKCLPFSFFTV